VFDSIVVVVVAVALRNDAGQWNVETADPHEGLVSRPSGQKTYRAPEGRPGWAQPADLILPIISPADVEIELARDRRAIYNSGSADHADDGLGIRSWTPEPHFAIHHSESGDYTVTGQEGMFGVPPQSDPPILESQATSGTIHGDVDEGYGNGSAGSRREMDVEQFSEDSPVMKRSYTYSIPALDIQSDRKPRKKPTRSAQTAKVSCTRSANSGSGRHSLVDRTDRYRVGSTRRVGGRDSAENRKCPAERTATEKTRILTEVNRKYCGEGPDLMTSSVSASVSRSADDMRSSASCATEQTMTSSKPTTPPLQRHLATTHSRVGLFLYIVFIKCMKWFILLCGALLLCEFHF